MSIATISSSSLKKLISLVEKRDRLQTELLRLEKQISAALGGKGVGPTPPLKVASHGGAKRGKRGALKSGVLDALKAAGKQGISVKALSSKLGVKNQNLHVWFNTTGKTIKGLKRSAPGHWVLS